MRHDKKRDQVIQAQLFINKRLFHSPWEISKPLTKNYFHWNLTFKKKGFIFRGIFLHWTQQEKWKINITHTVGVWGGKAWSVQLNSFRLFAPAGGKQRDLDKGLQECCSGERKVCVQSLNLEKMLHLGVVFVRLTNAAFFSPLTTAVGCSGVHWGQWLWYPLPLNELQAHT